MYPGSMDLGFWFCDTAHDAPCKLLCRAMFEEEFPYRLPIILLSFAFLATTQLIYYSCCIICPFLICQCYSNPPEWWFLYDDDDDEEEVPMTVARMKQQMALSETLDYRIFSELSKEERTIMSESCVICLYNYNHDDKVVRPKSVAMGFMKIVWLRGCAPAP